MLKIKQIVSCDGWWAVFKTEARLRLEKVAAFALTGCGSVVAMVDGGHGCLEAVTEFTNFHSLITAENGPKAWAKAELATAKIDTDFAIGEPRKGH